MAPFRCGICQQKFKNRPLIYNHALETGHNVNHCCRECLRWFDSEMSIAAHVNSSVHVKVVASGPANTSAADSEESPTNASPVVQLAFGGVTYTQLAHQQQDAIFNQLSTRCHSAKRLENEGYILDALKGPTSKISKPRPSLAEFQQTPPMQPAVTKRRAIVIDCEMAGTFDGSDELISLCAIDFLTGETLIDSFVSPSRPITDWRTKIHGMDATVIIEAAKHQNVLQGWAAAREELWKHIDEQTILIGQTILFDFEVLRLIHTRVVDSAILATEAVFGKKNGDKHKKPGRRWGLQELCETFLGIQIRRGGGIHNNLEDVLAAREVVLQYLLRRKDFKKWADQAREDFWKPKAGRKNKKKKNAKKTTTQSVEKTAPAFETFAHYDGFYECLDNDESFLYHSGDAGIFEYEEQWFTGIPTIIF